MAKLCPQCKKENPSSANVCMYCGTRLVEQAEMDKIDALHSELGDAKETIKVLKDALKGTEQKKEADKHKEAIPTPPVLVPSEKKGEERKKFPYAVLFVGLALLLIVGVSIGYITFYKPYITDRDAPRFYTFAPNVFLRSSQESGVEYNKLSLLPYGSELIVYNNGYDWSEIKWKDNQTQKSMKGYISSAYILSAEDFKILNNIWGDTESKDIISTSKCRIALLKYFKDKGLSGWKVYSKSKDSKYNTTYYKRVISSNSKFTDFAVILKNSNSEERKCLLFSFDDDETPRLVYEEQAPPIGDIVSVGYKINPDYVCEYLITYR